MCESAFPKTAAQIVAGILSAHGVRDAILSPGSRNAPLIHAFTLCKEIRTLTVVDERTAAFVALGLCMTSRKPVALVCTSGTALLNYAPAVAEAYYRRLPLIVISADRPQEWIDQADGQTIRQPGALSHIVRQTYSITDTDFTGKDSRWFLERTLNDACRRATSEPQAPVHINLAFNTPLTPDSKKCSEFRFIRSIQPEPRLNAEEMKRLAEEASGRRILVVVGQLPSDNRLNKGMDRLSSLPGVVVLAETTANLHGQDIITNIEGTIISAHSFQKDIRPDLVIVAGGAIVSARLKKYLRGLSDVEFWQVGPSADLLEDTFRRLSLHISASASLFFPTFAKLLSHQNQTAGEFTSLWHELSEIAIRAHKLFTRDCPWSELKALNYIFPRIPEEFNLHLSNGTAVRYGLVFDCRRLHALFCNRGCSGIEGSTSTAIGSALCYRHPTLLITGDLSFSYDIGAMALSFCPANFKVVLLNNSGGGIFRFVATTRSLPCRETALCAPPTLPADKLCSAYGWNYFHASSAEELKENWSKFIGEADAPSLIEICVNPETSAEVFRRYLSTMIYSQT